MASFIPMNSHLPKYPVDVVAQSGQLPGGIRDQHWMPIPGRCRVRRSKRGRSTASIVAIDTFPDPITTAQRAFTLVIEPDCARTVDQQRCAATGDGGLVLCIPGERDRLVRRRCCRSPGCRPVFPSMPRRIRSAARRRPRVRRLDGHGEQRLQRGGGADIHAHRRPRGDDAVAGRAATGRRVRAAGDRSAGRVRRSGVAAGCGPALRTRHRDVLRAAIRHRAARPRRRKTSPRRCPVRSTRTAAPTSA